MAILSDACRAKTVAVLDLLMRGCIPTDDTLLEKFLTWLLHLLADTESCHLFLDATHFSDYLTRLESMSDADPAAFRVVVILSAHISQLCATCQLCLAGSEVHNSSGCYFVRGALCTLLARLVDDSALWCVASMRCLWLSAHKSLLNCADLALLHDADDSTVRRVLDCTMDNSWFVSREAAQLTAKLLNVLAQTVVDRPKITNIGVELDVPNSATEPDSSIKKGKAQTLHSLIVEFIVRPLGVNANAAPPVCPGSIAVSLDVLQQVYETGDCAAVMLICEPSALVSALCRLIEEGAAGNGRNTLDVNAMRVLTAFWDVNEERSDGMMVVIRGTMLRQFKSGRIHQAMMLGAWLCLRGLMEKQDNVCCCMLPIAAAVYSDTNWSRFVDGIQSLELRSMSTNVWSQLSSDASSFRDLLLLGLDRLSMHDPAAYSNDDTLNLICDLLESSTTAGSKNEALSCNAQMRIKCLDLCSKVLPGHVSPVAWSRLKLLLITLMLDNSSDMPNITKPLELMLRLLGHDASEEGEGVESEGVDEGRLRALAGVLRRCSCHPLWAIRDDVIGFVAKVAQRFAHCGSLMKWLCDEALHELVWQAVGDGESYVRACALNALSVISDNERLWQDLQARVPTDTIYEKLLGVSCHDPEAFGRRDAIGFLAKSYLDHKRRLSPLIRARLLDTMREATHDLDWEVKLRAVAFWAGHVASVLSAVDEGRVVAGVEELCEVGGVETLLGAARDCDTAVQREALVALIRLSERLLYVGAGKEPDCVGAGTEPGCIKKASTELGFIGASTEPGSIRAGMKPCCVGAGTEPGMQDLANDMQVLVKNGHESSVNDLFAINEQNLIKQELALTNNEPLLTNNEPPLLVDNDPSSINCISSTVAESPIDLPALHCLVSQSSKLRLMLAEAGLPSLYDQATASTDRYANNPESLLDDIIASCPRDPRGGGGVMEMTDDEDDVPVADCY